MESAPRPPAPLSWPGPSPILSLPAPPQTMSSPPRARTRSSPSPATTTSGPAVPRRASDPSVPTIVASWPKHIASAVAWLLKKPAASIPATTSRRPRLACLKLALSLPTTLSDRPVAVKSAFPGAAGSYNLARRPTRSVERGAAFFGREHPGAGPRRGQTGLAETLVRGANEMNPCQRPSITAAARRGSSSAPSSLGCSGGSRNGKPVREGKGLGGGDGRQLRLRRRGGVAPSGKP